MIVNLNSKLAGIPANRGTCKLFEETNISEGLQLMCTDDNFVGSACLFYCQDGAILNGVSVAICNEDGTWSDTIPSCESLSCC